MNNRIREISILLCVVFWLIGDIEAKKYYLRTEQAVTWYEALLRCEAQGLQLATIQTAEDQTHLLSVMRSANRLSQWMWTSGNDWAWSDAPVGPRQFVWRSTGKAFTFSKWNRNEPTNAGGWEHCVHVWPQDGDLTWNDLNCHASLFYICEDKVDKDKVTNIAINISDQAL